MYDNQIEDAFKKGLVKMHACMKALKKVWRDWISAYPNGEKARFKRKFVYNLLSSLYDLQIF